MRMPEKQLGFSLVELMISLALTLTITAAVIEVFIANKQMYRVQDAWSRLQENGRFAAQKLADSIRSAGYMGCATLGNVSVTNTLNDYSDSYLWDFSTAIEGFNASGTDSWSPTIDDSVSDALSGTDILTIRGAVPPSILVTKHPTSSADIQVNTSNGLEQYDIVMVTDCVNAAIFQVTSANPNTSGSVAHNTGTGDPGNSTKDLGDDYAGAEIYKIATTSFYIAEDDSGIPTLYKKVGDDDAEEIVPYVEDMQLMYGVDTSGDNAVDSYLLASEVSDWSEVISVKINLLLVSAEDNLTVDGGSHSVYFNGEEYSADDQHLRAAFYKTVNLRNRVP